MLALKVGVDNKLRRLVVRNRIVNNSDFKLSEVDRPLRYKSDSKTAIQSTIAILIKCRSLFAWSWSISIKNWKGLVKCRFKDPKSLLKDPKSHFKDPKSHLKDQKSHLKDQKSQLKDQKSQI